jgi:hypothetical protein
MEFAEEGRFFVKNWEVHDEHCVSRNRKRLTILACDFAMNE